MTTAPIRRYCPAEAPSNPSFAPSCTAGCRDESRPRSSLATPGRPVGPAGVGQLVDPEDDLPSATYGGDFETTKIPHYSSDIPPAPVPAPAPAPASGYSLLHDPEPLPYVQPHSTAGHALAGPMEIDPIDDAEACQGRSPARHPGSRPAALAVGIGAIFIAHGLQKAFGWWGGGGIDGFKTALADAGYQHAGILTYVGAGAQIAGRCAAGARPVHPLAAAGRWPTWSTAC